MRHAGARLIEPSRPSIDRQLEEFRRGYLPRDWLVNGLRWTGYDAGSPGPPVLLLHGGLFPGEALFPLFDALASFSRPILPDTPRKVATMKTAVDGLVGILDRHWIDQVHVVGHALGGGLAQWLVRRAPHRVASLTLVAAQAPGPRHAQRIEADLASMSRMSERRLRQRMYRDTVGRAAQDLATMAAHEDAFWERYLVEILLRPGLKDRLIAEARLAIEYHRGAAFGFNDLNAWRGRVRLVRFSGPGSGDEADAQELAQIYPGAQVTDYPDVGPMGLTVKAHDIAAQVLKATRAY
jgi:pimeloyl-ACP methyl ester carboxylesterase